MKLKSYHDKSKFQCVIRYKLKRQRNEWEEWET